MNYVKNKAAIISLSILIWFFSQLQGDGFFPGLLNLFATIFPISLTLYFLSTKLKGLGKDTYSLKFYFI